MVAASVSLSYLLVISVFFLSFIRLSVISVISVSFVYSYNCIFFCELVYKIYSPDFLKEAEVGLLTNMVFK